MSKQPQGQSSIPRKERQTTGSNNTRMDVKKQHVSSGAGNDLIANPTYDRKNICYCLATKHDFVTNCMNCGYILCSTDANKTTQNSPLMDNDLQYLPCPFCQNKCYLPISLSSSTAGPSSSSSSSNYSQKLQNHLLFDEDRRKAYELKDRLLVYDREYAQRTVVYDAQGDYYNHAGAQWLSEEEKKRLIAKEERRMERNKNNTRGKGAHRVNINFDVMGRRIVEVNDPELDDDEDEDEDGIETHGTKRENQEKARERVCAAILDERDDFPHPSQQGGHSGINHQQEEEGQRTEQEGSSRSISEVASNDLAYKNSKAGEVYRQLKSRG
jgi:hypothetical protein